MMKSSIESRSGILLMVALLWVISLSGGSTAFVLQQPRVSSSSSSLPITQSKSISIVQLSANINDNNNNNNNNSINKGKTSSWIDTATKTLASSLVAACLWAAPLPTGYLVTSPPGQQLPVFQNINVAMAKEMASGSGARVNKDAESLLRFGLPIKNKEVRKLQVTLETIKLDISSKRKTAAEEGVKKSRTLMSGNNIDKYTSSCRNPKLCAEILTSMVKDLDPLENSIKESMESLNGSNQERAALDKAYVAQKKVVDQLTVLEEQMIPTGYQVPVPEQYQDLPILRGRATVEMLIVKANKGDTFDVSGTTFPEARMTMIIDGYAAPVTAGNFIELVSKGFYDKMEIQRSDGFVVQTGDPPGEADGYVAPGSKSVGNGKHGERLIPLEILVSGDAGPIYETTIEDDGRGGQATVLPFSSYGAMGWAREEYDPNSGSSQFFWLLFDSDLTPAGKNVLDGRYPCFGYVVDGAEFLQDVKEGDVIVSAKVTKGAENLVLQK